ncbi:MAG: hypothetical protein AB1779_00850 [Candidatus Thermoplasmatota archaeon]
MRDWAAEGWIKIKENIWKHGHTGQYYVPIEDKMRSIDLLTFGEMEKVGIDPSEAKVFVEENKKMIEARKQKRLENIQESKTEPKKGGEMVQKPQSEESKVNIVEKKEPAELAEIIEVENEIVRPAVSVETAVAMWNEYLKLTKAILTDEDYVEIRGKKFKKKSAWRKYERFFNISVPSSSVKIEKYTDAEGRLIKAEVTLEAVAPNGRKSVGWGSCSISDKAHKEDKKSNGNVICKGPCDGRIHFSHPEHDILATAMTRARNRSVADLIGAGEISAEEIE